MKLLKWLPDAATDFLRDFVPAALTYSGTGTFTPYGLQRLVGFMIQDHITDAIASVMLNVTTQQEYPLDIEPDEPTQYLFAARDLSTIGNRFPLCFITFGSIRSMRQASIQGGSANKKDRDAVYDLIVTPVVRDPDPEIADIKCQRLVAAIEIIVINSFMDASLSPSPRDTPLTYLDLDISNIKWIPGPIISVVEKGATKMWSINFPIRKRLRAGVT